MAKVTDALATWFIHSIIQPLWRCALSCDYTVQWLKVGVLTKSNISPNDLPESQSADIGETITDLKTEIAIPVEDNFESTNVDAALHHSDESSLDTPNIEMKPSSTTHEHRRLMFKLLNIVSQCNKAGIVHRPLLQQVQKMVSQIGGNNQSIDTCNDDNRLDDMNEKPLSDQTSIYIRSAVIIQNRWRHSKFHGARKVLQTLQLRSLSKAIPVGREPFFSSTPANRVCVCVFIYICCVFMFSSL